ncbi:RidA family protein [Burkholderia plantarii]|uniref:RidA family protein n=1 Tax=Burkholderia plantarii TaxID=41899 RepID=UPI00272955A7|nr:RidA family protein [Burkholderia plantarii]WLE59679.1 RidA family protein [Burkholderia plantarii]
MTSTISGRVAALGLTLPSAPPAVANYLPFVRYGDLLHVAGQISRRDGQPACLGRLGDALSIDDGVEAARLAALGVIAQIAAATDDQLARVARIVRLTVFVACTPDFDRHPLVANGASDLVVDVFGEAGRHVRSAVGVASLPAGVAIEVDAVVALAAPSSPEPNDRHKDRS